MPNPEQLSVHRISSQTQHPVRGFQHRGDQSSRQIRALDTERHAGRQPKHIPIIITNIYLLLITTGQLVQSLKRDQHAIVLHQ